MSNIYLGTISAGGDGPTLLMANINALMRQSNPNHVDLLVEDFEFSVPELVTVPTPTRNTKVYMGPTLESGYYGVREVYYNRIHASELGQISLTYESETTIRQLAPRLSEKLGILIKSEDLVDGPITPPSGGETSITVDLEFDPTSFIYYSGTQVRLGDNDPSGEGVAVPYVNAMTFAFDQKRVVNPAGASEPSYLGRPFSLAIGVDNRTKNIAELSPVLQGNGASAYVRIRYDDATVSQMKVGQLPFVGYWRDALSGLPRAINGFGDVFELSDDGLEWSQVGSWFGIGENDIAKVKAALLVPRVKAVVQDADNSVYILARAENDTPGVWKVDPATGNRTKLALPASRLKSLSQADWNTCKVEDFLISNGRMWMLVKATTQYDVHATKGRNTPAVEVVIVSNLTTNYYPLENISARFSGIAFNMASADMKWRLMTPPNDGLHCDVVALVPTRRNNHMKAVVYRHQAAGEYLAYILPNSRIPVDPAQRADLDICGYQIPLTVSTARLAGNAVAAPYLEVIQILAPVEVDDFNRYFLASETRTATKFLGYGLISMTSVGTRQGNSPWVETRSALESDYKPTMVALTDKVNRLHVVFQNGYAVHKSIFTQAAQTAEFKVTIDSSASLDNHTGFSNVSPIGLCKWTRPAIAEQASPSFELAAPSNGEAALPAIDFSFVATDGTGAPAWLTAPTGTPALTRRVSSPDYAFMGGVPAAVFAEGSNLYYWCRNGFGVYTSTDKGATWNEYNNAPHFYRQLTPQTGHEVLGTAFLNFLPQDFKRGAVTSGEIFAELKVSRTLNLFSISNNSVNASTPISESVLYHLKPYTEGNVAQEIAPLVSYGLNLLSNSSPRQVIAWDLDPDLDLEVIGRTSSSPATPLDTDVRIEDYMFGTAGEIIDFNRDVKYLGVRHAFTVKDGDKYRLYYTDAVQPTLTYSLSGYPGVPFNFMVPEVSFHIWDAVDDVISYMPFVVYGNKRVLLAERLKTDNTFIMTSHVLNIPDDNGEALTLVPMFTANRKEYWFAQKGNGIFKLVYAWDAATETSTVSLIRVFTLNTPTMNQMVIHSGCVGGIAARNAPLEVGGDDYPPEGYEIGFVCSGTTKTTRIADGVGGWTETVTPNHVDCGGTVTSRVMPGGLEMQGE